MSEKAGFVNLDEGDGMEKKRQRLFTPGLRVLYIFILDEFIEAFVFTPFLSFLQLDFWADIVLYKALSLVIILGLNLLLLRQKIIFRMSFGWPSWQKFVFWDIVGCLVAWQIFTNRNFLDILQASVIGTIAAVPEEYLYRGVIFGGLLRAFYLANRGGTRRNFIYCMLLSSLAFSLAHLSNLPSQGAVATVGQMIQVSGMGMLLAALYVRYGTLLMPIFVHFMIDFLVTLIHGPYPSKLNGVSDETTLIIVSLIWAGIYLAISMWTLWHCHDKEGFMARLAGQTIK